MICGKLGREDGRESNHSQHFTIERHLVLCVCKRLRCKRPRKQHKSESRSSVNVLTRYSAVPPALKLAVQHESENCPIDRDYQVDVIEQLVNWIVCCRYPAGCLPKACMVLLSKRRDQDKQYLCKLSQASPVH